MLTNEIENLYQVTMVEVQKIQLALGYGLIIMLMGLIALGYIAIAHTMLKKNNKEEKL